MLISFVSSAISLGAFSHWLQVLSLGIISLWLQVLSLGFLSPSLGLLFMYVTLSFCILDFPSFIYLTDKSQKDALSRINNVKATVPEISSKKDSTRLLRKCEIVFRRAGADTGGCTSCTEDRRIFRSKFL